MPKTKKTRQSINWKNFFKLVQQGSSNEIIAKRLGIRIDAKSDDPFKPIRAMKSRAKTVGVTIDGETVKLKVPIAGKAPKPKAKAKTKPRTATEMAAAHSIPAA